MQRMDAFTTDNKKGDRIMKKIYAVVMIADVYDTILGEVSKTLIVICAIAICVIVYMLYNN